MVIPITLVAEKENDAITYRTDKSLVYIFI